MKRLIALVLAVTLVASAFCLEAFAKRSDNRSGTYHGYRWQAFAQYMGRSSSTDCEHVYGRLYVTNGASARLGVYFRMNYWNENGVLVQNTRGEKSLYDEEIVTNVWLPTRNCVLRSATLVCMVDGSQVTSITVAP